MGLFIQNPPTLVKEWTLNLAQAAATYDVTTATGDLYIDNFTIYVATAGATFTSVAIQTNDTNIFAFLTALEGAVANITEGKTLVSASTGKPTRLTSGKKIQFTMVGTTGTGSLRLVVKYMPITAGAALS